MRIIYETLGLIIASNLQTWIQDFYSFRLSQILDMYYSYEGIAFNPNVIACDRARNFIHAVSRTILNEQVCYNINENTEIL